MFDVSDLAIVAPGIRYAEECVFHVGCDALVRRPRGWRERLTPMKQATARHDTPLLGFVGLGNMGAPICLRLLQHGYQVTVFDVERERMNHLVEAGARAADSLAALGAASDVVLLSLPTSTIIEEVTLSPDGLAHTMRAGSALIDLSSAQPSSSRRIASELATRGVSMLDAPVSGGVPRARDGDLTVMAGGDPELFERYRPILEAFSSAQFHVGPVGAGDLVKALNNLLSATTLASAAEVVSLAERAGLDPERFIDVVNRSSGRSNSTEVKFPRYILNHSFADGFALALMDKDVHIALQAAAEIGAPLPIGSLVARIWRSAAEAGFAQQGHTAIYAYLEERLRESGEALSPVAPEQELD